MNLAHGLSPGGRPLAGRLSNVPTRQAAIVLSALAVAALAGIAVAELEVSDIRLPLIAILAAVLGGAYRAGLNRFLVCVGGLAYVLALHVVYVEVVVPAYAYTGLTDAGAALSSWVVVSLIALYPLLILPVRLARPSEVVVWLLYLVGYVPTTLMPLYILGPALGPVLPLEILVAIGFGGMLAMQRLPRRALPWRGLSEAGFTRLAMVSAVASVAFLLVFFGIPTQIPDFASVYDARADFGAVQANVPGAGYVVAWASNVIFPLALAIGLTRRRYRALILGTGGELLIYSLQGSKTVLFAIVLVPLLVIAVRWSRNRFGVWVAWFGVATVAASVAATALTGSLWPVALSVVRLVALPGQLASYYYDFFTSHEPYLLSHSIFRAFTDSPYTSDPPFLIGGLYLHSVVDANANIWADAIANFGLPGIIVFSVILGGMFWLLDSVGEGKEFVLVAAMVAVAAFTLANGALLTAILTNGIGLAIVLVALMPTRPPDPPPDVVPDPPPPQLEHADGWLRFAPPSASD